MLALCGLGAARVPTAKPEGLCIPLLMSCPTPTPSPTPTPPLGGLGSLLDGDVPAVVPSALADPNAPVMTLPAAQLGGSSISFTGLQSVTVVTVPLANGGSTPVIRLAASTITITDFVLDVRKATGSALVSTATRMELKGNVVAYIDSASATLLNGAGLTVGVLTPPPGDELPSKLLRVTLGLVGVTADSISFVASHQEMHG